MTDATDPAEAGAEADESLPGIEQVVRRLLLSAAAIAILITALPIMMLAWVYQGAIERGREQAVAHSIEHSVNYEIARIADETGQIADTPIVATALTDTGGRHFYFASLLDQRAVAERAELLLRDYRGRPVIAFPEAEAERIMQAARAVPLDPRDLTAHTRVRLEGSMISFAAPIVFFASQRAIGVAEMRIELARLFSAAMHGERMGYVVSVRHSGAGIFGPSHPPGRRGIPITLRLPGNPPGTIEMELLLSPEEDEAWRFLSLALIATACVGFVAFLGAILLARRMARSFAHPLAGLVQASRHFQQGDLRSGGIARPAFREFAILAQAITLAFRTREEAHLRLRFDAEHDALTELHNRAAFDAIANERIQAAASHGSAFAVLYLDLDRFKPVNDRYGHEAGDIVLREVARRLCATVRTRDLVSRRGGDEFTLLLDSVSRPGVAEHVARQIIEAVQQPILVEPEVSVGVGASVGIALYPGDAATLRDLLEAADLALAEVKATGCGRSLWVGHVIPAG